MALTKSRAVQQGQFGTNETLREAWEQEARRLRLEAARYIFSLIGKSDTEKLRAAVAPEELKDVLAYAGARYDTFMVIGEGKEEVRALVQERARRIGELKERITVSSEKKQQPILDALWKKLHAEEAQLIPLEEKERWTPEQVLRYHYLQKQFEDTFGSLQRACEEIRTTASAGQVRVNPLDALFKKKSPPEATNTSNDPPSQIAA